MTDVYTLYSTCLVSGVALGFSLGFISWAIGFAIYGIIRWFKSA